MTTPSPNLLLPSRAIRAVFYIASSLDRAPELTPAGASSDTVRQLIKTLSLALAEPQSSKAEVLDLLASAMPALTQWAKEHVERTAYVEVLDSVLHTERLALIPTPHDILMGTIARTPGLLARFQSILTGDTVADYLALSEDEKSCYEQYRQSMAQGL